jgi:plasmid stabilization system protein ParE
MIRIELSIRALRDLEQFEKYWIDRDPTTYSDLIEALGMALRFLAENPGAGSPVDDGLKRRKWRIGRVRHERTDWRRPH